MRIDVNPSEVPQRWARMHAPPMIQSAGKRGLERCSLSRADREVAKRMECLPADRQAGVRFSAAFHVEVHGEPPSANGRDIGSKVPMFRVSRVDPNRWWMSPCGLREIRMGLSRCSTTWRTRPRDGTHVRIWGVHGWGGLFGEVDGKIERVRHGPVRRGRLGRGAPRAGSQRGKSGWPRQVCLTFFQNGRIACHRD